MAQKMSKYEEGWLESIKEKEGIGLWTQTDDLLGLIYYQNIPVMFFIIAEEADIHFDE